MTLRRRRARSVCLPGLTLAFALGVVAAGDPEIDRARTEAAAGRVREAAVRLIRAGEAARRDGDPATGLARLEAAAELAPRLGGAHAALGQAYVLADRHASAIPALRRALEAGAPPDPVSFLLAGALWETGRLDEAEDLYRRLFEAGGPQAMPAAAALGSLRVWRGRAAAALGPLRAAHAAAPGDPAVAFDLARALEEAGHADDALARYLSLADGAPDRLGAQYRAARLLAKLGRTGEARERMDRYRTAYARDQIAAHERQAVRAALDRAWRRHAAGDYDAARAAFSALPDVAEAHAGLAAVAETEGRTADARRILAAAALRWPEDDRIRRRRARLAGGER